MRRIPIVDDDREPRLLLRTCVEKNNDAAIVSHDGERFLAELPARIEAIPRRDAAELHSARYDRRVGFTFDAVERMAVDGAGYVFAADVSVSSA